MLSPHEVMSSSHDQQAEAPAEAEVAPPVVEEPLPVQAAAEEPAEAESAGPVPAPLPKGVIIR